MTLILNTTAGRSAASVGTPAGGQSGADGSLERAAGFAAVLVQTTAEPSSPNSAEQEATGQADTPSTAGLAAQPASAETLTSGSVAVTPLGATGPAASAPRPGMPPAPAVAENVPILDAPETQPALEVVAVSVASSVPAFSWSAFHRDLAAKPTLATTSVEDGSSDLGSSAPVSPLADAAAVIPVESGATAVTTPVSGDANTAAMLGNPVSIVPALLPGEAAQPAVPLGRFAASVTAAAVLASAEPLAAVPAGPVVPAVSVLPAVPVVPAVLLVPPGSVAPSLSPLRSGSVVLPGSALSSGSVVFAGSGTASGSVAPTGSSGPGMPAVPGALVTPVSRGTSPERPSVPSSVSGDAVQAATALPPSVSTQARVARTEFLIRAAGTAPAEVVTIGQTDSATANANGATPALPVVAVMNPATPVAPAAPPTSVASPIPLTMQVAKPLFTLSGVKPGEHVLTINVTPDNLGPLTVRAHVTADTIRVELFAPTDLAREALRAILPELRRDLAGGGLNAQLDLSSQSQARDARADAQSDRQQRPPPGTRDGPGDEPPPRRPRSFPSNSSSTIDVMA